MTATIEEVVPWGRSYEEYIRMFDLAEMDLEKNIIGCADGPAAFNAEMTEKGRRVVSTDPIYAFSADQIRERIDDALPLIVANTLENMEGYIWNEIASIDELVRVRSASMDRFLEDYPVGREDDRYQCQSLPSLSFEDNAFDLALCSHFLFLYSEKLSCSFHIDAALEMARVANEVRIFPLLDLDSRPSPHVNAVVAALREKGFTATIEAVPYEYQKGADKMLRIRKQRP